jgi:hypothetical protein
MPARRAPLIGLVALLLALPAAVALRRAAAPRAGADKVAPASADLTPPPSAAPSAAPGRAEGESSSTACEDIDRYHRALLEPLQRRVGDRLKLVSEERPWQLAEVFRCYATPRGAWALRLGTPTVTNDEDGSCSSLQARYSFERLDPQGRPVPLPASLARSLGLDAKGEAELSFNNYGYDRPLPLTVFDWDDDGEPEAVFGVEGFADEGNGYAGSRAAITFRDGAPSPFGPKLSNGLTDVRDVDGDGRPDWIVDAPWNPYKPSCLSGSPTNLTPLTLVMHSLPGGSFSLTDGVAAGAARRACASVPAAPLVVRDGEGLDYEATAARMACARVAGRSGADLVRALRSEGCRTFFEVEGCTPYEVAPDACPSWALELARAPLPLTF